MTTVDRSWSVRTRLLLALSGVSIVLGLAALLGFFTPGSDEVSPVPAPPPGGVIGPDEGAAIGETSARFEGERAKVRLMIRPALVREGERPSMTLLNAGKTDLSFGLHFKLEMRTPAGWHWVNEDQAFDLPLLHLSPGERTDGEEVAVYVDTPEPLPLAPGVYRVSRTVDTDASDEEAPSLDVAARFEVARADGTRDPARPPGAPFLPYPGSQWFGPDGSVLPTEEEIMNVITGPDHCEWQSAAMLHTTWPLGTAPEKGSSRLQYIRDPKGVMDARLAKLFQQDVSLPGGTRYTGYRTDFMELWVRTYHRGMPVAKTSRPPDRIYLLFADRVESWPRAKDMIACG